MSKHSGRDSGPNLPCTWQPEADCPDCEALGRLACRFDRRDLINFLMIVLPFGVISISGMIRAGSSLFLLPWLGYALFFFVVWEARVLCRHCPYWAQNGSVLRCPANYGVIKIWRHDPGPMSVAERFQFVLGALLLIAYPLPFLVVGGQFLLAGIGLSAAAAGA